MWDISVTKHSIFELSSDTIMREVFRFTVLRCVYEQLPTCKDYGRLERKVLLGRRASTFHNNLLTPSSENKIPEDT